MRKSVTLECSAINVNKSITRLDYQWQKEFVDISGASKNTYETLEPGSYRCKITNGYRTVYTQDAIVTLEPIWVTDIIINTQSITNSGKIQYTINPEEADNKTITFDTKITPDYTIDAAGNVTINTDGCNFEVVARSQFGKDYSEVIGRKTIIGYNRVAVKSITITTTTIQDTGQIQTSVSPENASIVKKEFELLSGSEYVVMDSTGYVSEVKSPGTFSVRVSGFDKVGNVVTNTKSIAATNEFVKITGVSITTDTVSEGNTITYKTIPPSVPANLKSVMIELYNQGNSDYVNVNIDSNGKVTGITEDMNGKKFKAKITVVDKYDNTVSNTKEITCKSVISVKSITVPSQTITDSGNVKYTISPSNATNKNVKFSFKSSTSNATIDPSTGKITVTNDGSVVVVVTAQDGSGVKGEGTITLKKTPVEPTGDYFIAKTARGDKSGRGSWDNATDDIKTFDYNDIGVIKLGNTYVETGKVCDVGERWLNLGGCVIGGCEVGSFDPKPNDRSDINNINNINGIYGIVVDQTSATLTNCNFYNINVYGNSGRGVRMDRISATITNCDFYNISGGMYGVEVRSISATITNCDFYNISSGVYGVYVSDIYGYTSATLTNCNFYNISGGDGGISYGVTFTNTSATITNCTFSAIESNNPTNYTLYSDLIKILPPETGCKFLPEGRPQSIYFDDDCIINGKKVSDLLNTPTNPTIIITPDSLTDSGTIAYTITPQTSCQFAIINGTFDAVEIGTVGNVTTDDETMWFVGTKTIDIASVKYDSNLVVRVSCMDGSGYYVDKTIPVKSTKIQSLKIDLPSDGYFAEHMDEYAPVISSSHRTMTIPFTITPNNSELMQYVKFKPLNWTLTESGGSVTYTLTEAGVFTAQFSPNQDNYYFAPQNDIEVTAYTIDGSNLSSTIVLWKKYYAMDLQEYVKPGI